MIGGHGRVVRERSALSLSPSPCAPSPGARSGLRMPARRPGCRSRLPGALLRQQFLRDGRRPAALPRSSSVPRQESARASERGGGKSKVGKGPQERNFRFNGQLRRRRHQQQRGRGEGGREGSGIVFLEYGATQATDDENARPARHGGLHSTRGREARGERRRRQGALADCRVQCRYTPRVVRTPHVRVFSRLTS